MKNIYLSNLMEEPNEKGSKVRKTHNESCACKIGIKAVAKTILKGSYIALYIHGTEARSANKGK